MSPLDLHFERTVRETFGFLSTKYSFTCRESSPISVLYASGSVEVEVTLDPRSYEVGVEVRRVGENRSFPLHRIVELSSPTEAQRWRLVQTSTPERVDEFMPKLASLLEKYADRALLGDPKTFARLEDLEDSDAMRTTREFQIREARKLADHEWRCRNYAKLVSILTPIQEELTDSELARFLYAKKRLEARES